MRGLSMTLLKPKKLSVIDGTHYFNPYENKHARKGIALNDHGFNKGNNGKIPVCVCGYELLKESENTFKCAGGNHRYIMELGDIIKDKFGGIWLKKPEENKKNE